MRILCCGPLETQRGHRVLVTEGDPVDLYYFNFILADHRSTCPLLVSGCLLLRLPDYGGGGPLKPVFGTHAVLCCACFPFQGFEYTQHTVAIQRECFRL